MLQGRQEGVTQSHNARPCVFPFCIGTGVGSAGVRPAFSADGSAPFGRLSRRTVGRGAVLPKAQITLPGGVGILPGAMVGGILLGIVETMVSAYISTGYRDAISFTILIVVLLFMPNGMFGKKAINKV